MISHTNSGVAFWHLPEEPKDEDENYYTTTWRTLPEDTLATKRPTEDIVFGILFMKQRGVWDDERYLAL